MPKDFPYKRMVEHMWATMREDMDEWQERFIKAMKAKLDHPDAVSDEEISEFLSKKEKMKIVEIWNSCGL